jgi:YbgC/YbaW family acyl-CoA thioester hydrolase
MKQNIIERRIMWGDLDALGIVFYPRYYEWIDACGHLFFEAINLNMKELWREKKILFGLMETSCRYFVPGRYHQMIRITTTMDALKKKTLLLKHHICLSQSDEMMVEGFEKRICLDVSDPGDFRAIPIPEDIYTILKEAMEEP